MLNRLENDWMEIARAMTLESPINLLPRMRTLLEVALKDYYKTHDQEWPPDLAAAISRFTEGNQLDRNLRFSLHEIRVKANQVLHEGFKPSQEDAKKGLLTLKAFLRFTHGLVIVLPAPSPKVPPASAAPEDAPQPEESPAAVPTHEPSPRQGGDHRLARVMDVDLEARVLLVQAAQGDGAPDGPLIRVIPGARFQDLLNLDMKFRLVNLVDEVLGPQAGVSRPRLIVVEPDYLINVTQIAECMQKNGPQPSLALLEALMPRDSSRAQFLGNLVNQALDREVEAAAKGVDFDLDSFIKKDLFQTNSLTLSTLKELQDDQGVRDLLAELRSHHTTIRHARRQGFISQATGYSQRPAIQVQAASLEPSFMSAKYGLQGRLDLLHMSEDGYDVVELKSSRKFPSFSRMVWSNHKAQALLYRLLLEEAIPSATRAQGQTSILYSAAKADEGPIRHVLSEPETTEVLMAVRNRIVLTECLMAESSGPTRTHELLEPIMEGRDRLNLAGFTADHARCVASAWLGCDAVESAWGHEYLRFIAKELRLNLIGKPGAFSVPGSQASIWRASLRAKRVAGCLLDDLSAEPVNPEDPSRLKLRLPALLSGADPGEANFREGDALLLYPRHRTKEPGNQRLSPLQSQILKVTLERFVEDGVIVNLMNRLVSPSFFRDHDLWALEPSMYDTFRQEWAGITGLLALPADQRCRLLGRTPPRQPQMDPPRELDEVDAALAAPDYYLLCGPPGTGKTSTALQRIVEGLFRSGKTILLAAYTRRAVDEICAMLEKLCKDPAFDYVRMTTPLYTDPAYHARLLETRLAACTTRVGVRELLLRCRIFVGTVSGLNRNTELFQLKEFDVAIIDEASQILEIPTLMLVSRVKKFILVGDHKQLPAVVVQSKDESAVSPEVSDLLSQELGLTNLRNSYFERLYCLAEAKWTWACGTLKTQYRMHREIMDLVNHRFYGGVLTCGEDRQHQEGLGRDNWKAGRSKLSDWIRSRRVMFIPARRTDEDLSSKECHEEARLASQFALELCEGYGPAFDPAHTVGIIASYRNQVALIHRQLELLAAEHGKPELAKVTVDTVERFQGSQRAVIILSFCCHFDWQLEQLVADSEGNDEGQTVDRKLNVALTRAKDQLILLGSPEILAKASGYAGVLADIRAKGAMAEGAN